jgi:P27 family predicted phage terminase small subunit
MAGVKGRSGRRPKPNVVKLITDNPGKRPIQKQDPWKNCSTGTGMPECPDHLSPEARAKWQVFAPQLYSAGLLTELDADMLAALCETWALWTEAKEKLADEGVVVAGPRGSVRPSPWVGIARRRRRICKD